MLIINICVTLLTVAVSASYNIYILFVLNVLYGERRCPMVSQCFQFELWDVLLHALCKNSATNKVMLNNARKVGELVLCRTSCFLHSSEMERKYY
jgi:hypothetical protein